MSIDVKLLLPRKKILELAGKPGKANGDFLEKFPFQELIE
jgi:hypothetical protein